MENLVLSSDPLVEWLVHLIMKIRYLEQGAKGVEDRVFIRGLAFNCENTVEEGGE